jgi:hypothetical protein
MKRSLAVLALALLISLVLGAGVANATHSNGQGPKHDKVNGTGQFVDQTTDQQIHVNANSGPEGQGARGWLWEKTTTGTDEIAYKAKVTCLAVSGNKSVIGGQIVNSKTGETGYVVVYVEDNGEPGKGSDRVERVFSATAPTCEEEFPTAKTITKGNYIVHDATTDSG